MVIDPVCGVEMEQHEAVGVSEYHEKIYYFCSGICKDEFDQEPEKYVRHPAQPVL
jgi:YHS domain-containing protein